VVKKASPSFKVGVRNTTGCGVLQTQQKVWQLLDYRARGREGSRPVLGERRER
jgi:hypothetical protein